MNTFFTCEQKLGNTIFTFSQKAKVLSTSPLNGGLTRHLSHAVNINCMNGSYECKMLGDTYEKDLGGGQSGPFYSVSRYDQDAGAVRGNQGELQD